jgi:hypothetical protein
VLSVGGAGASHKAENGAVRRANLGQYGRMLADFIYSGLAARRGALSLGGWKPTDLAQRHKGEKFMRVKRVFVLVGLCLTMALGAYAVCGMSTDCPLHDGWKANYTGTKMVDGVMVCTYHCPFVSAGNPHGHDFIVRSK